MRIQYRNSVKRNAIVVVAAFAALFSSAAYAFDWSEYLVNRIRLYFPSFNESEPGYAIVVTGDNLYLSDTPGKASLAPDYREIWPDTPFHSGSLGKMFTAMAILQLLEQGEIQVAGLEDLGIDHLVKDILADGEWPTGEDWQKVRIRDLLMHTSGIWDYLNDSDKNDPSKAWVCFWSDLGFDVPCWTNKKFVDLTNAAVLSKLGETPFHFSPGDTTAWMHWDGINWDYDYDGGIPIQEKKSHYSDSNYVILALIVEKVSGLTFREYVESNIFQPLNMTNSYVYQDYASRDDMTDTDGDIEIHPLNNHPPAPRPKRALGHVKVFFDWSPWDHDVLALGDYGDSHVLTVGDQGMYISLEDYTRFFSAVADILDNPTGNIEDKSNPLGVSFKTFTTLIASDEALPFESDVPWGGEEAGGIFKKGVQNMNQGFGWIVSNDRTSIWHNGQLTGFASIGMITGALDEGEQRFVVDRSVIILSNGIRDAYDTGRRHFGLATLLAEDDFSE